MRKWFRVAVGVFIVLAVVMPCRGEEVRTWTAASGATIDALYVESRGASAVLEKPDGKRFQIALARLSKQDRAYIEQLAFKALESEPPPPENYKAPIGKISPAIQCKDASKWSYHLYLPSSFNLSREWPVMFVMSPGGGKSKTLQRYIAGAEKNAWILALSVQSKNGFEESTPAMLAMVDDVMKEHPIDAKRLYASGFSGGGRMAFILAEQYKDREFAGVLPCGAGATRADIWKDTMIYGLCGSNCFNRWDMACTKKILKNDFYLWFVPGAHIWADSGSIADGISWLNGRYLKEEGQSSKLLKAEKHRYEKQQLEDIEALVDSDPERAYRLAKNLEEVGAQAHHRSDLAAQISKLSAMPNIQAYAKAEAGMHDLVDRHFGTDLMDYRNNNCPPTLTKAAEALADTCNELKLATTIRKMGGPTKIP